MAISLSIEFVNGFGLYLSRLKTPVVDGEGNKGVYDGYVLMLPFGAVHLGSFKDNE